MKILSALCLTLLLAACGGSSNSPSPQLPIPPVNPPTPGPVVNDSFFTRVMQLIGMSPDDEDGATVEGVILTTLDDTEPVAVS